MKTSTYRCYEDEFVQRPFVSKFDILLRGCYLFRGMPFVRVTFIDVPKAVEFINNSPLREAVVLDKRAELLTCDSSTGQSRSGSALITEPVCQHLYLVISIKWTCFVFLVFSVFYSFSKTILYIGNYVTFESLLSPTPVCRLSVCLSSVLCRLSLVSNVRAHYSGVEAFGNISSALSTFAILWPPCKILRRSSQGNLTVRGV